MVTTCQACGGLCGAPGELIAGQKCTCIGLGANVLAPMTERRVRQIVQEELSDVIETLRTIDLINDALVKKLIDEAIAKLDRRDPSLIPIGK